MLLKKLKIFGIILILTAVIFAAVPISVSAEGTCPEGMISYWKLDEGTGTTAIDSIDANDGTLLPLPKGPTWTTGKIDGALSFDGVDDYVSVPHSINLNIEDAVTVEAWVKFNTLTTPIFVSKGVYQNYNYRLYHDGDQFQFAAYIGSGYETIFTTGMDYISVTEWYHVAGVYDGSAMKVYVNGVLDGEKPMMGALYTNNYPLYLGKYLGGGWNLNGLIDEVAIFNRALTTGEIQQHYNNGNGLEITPDNSIVGLWHLNDGKDTTAIDSSGLGNHGILEPGGPTWANGQVGNALSFDGVDDYVSIPHSINLNIENAVTVESWVKFNALTTPIFVSKGVYPNYNYRLYHDGDQFQFAACIDSGFETIFTTGVDYISVTEWYHVAGVYDGSTMKVYVNGVLDGEKPITGALYTNNNPLLLGRYIGGGWCLNGLIDEVSIWNKALTTEEILQHYTNGLINKGYCYVPPDQAVQNLFEDITEQDIPTGSENSLLSKLDAAIDCIETGDEKSAMNILNAFINAVKAQSGKKLTVEQADELIAAAQQIIESIGS